MNNSYFWRMVAIAAVAALIYVGHGLHGRSNSPSAFEIATPVRAEGVGVTYNTQENSVIITTSSNDGKTIYLFSRRAGNLKPVYLGSASVDQ